MMWMGLLAVGAAFLYLARLDSMPAYLSIEEVSQAREAVIFAAPGPDRGQSPPPDIAHDSRAGRDPQWIYLAPLWVAVAAVPLKMLPFSEALVRLPSACAGVLNVVLMFLVGRGMFGGTRPAVIAAGLLMLTPAHFLQSRIGTGQIATVTFVLAWLIFLVRYINADRRRDLVAATFCLGLSLYAYAGALVIMPIYFLVTLAVVVRF